MEKRFLILLVIILLMVANVAAQQTTSLSQAIITAFKNRKNLQAGKLDITIQQLKTRSLYRKYGPQVAAEYNHNYNPILQSSIIPVGKFNSAVPTDATATIQFGTTWSQSAGVTASQPLFDATIQKQLNESRIQERISGASQAQTEYELAYAVSKAYVDIWLQQQLLDGAIIDTARTWLLYQLQLDKFTTGRLLKSELNNAIINHNNTKQQLAAATIQLVENKIYLLFLTGRSAGEADDFRIDSTLFTNNKLLLADTNITFDSIPFFQQLKLQKQLSVLQQQSERSKYIPVVSVKGFIGANQYSNDFNPVRSNSWFGYSYVGLDVKLPLLPVEAKKNKIQQLKLQSQQYSAQLDDKGSQLNQEALKATLELRRVAIQLRTLENNIVLYKENLRILQDRFQEQQITAIELNRQEYELQKLLTDYQHTKANGWLYELAILNATGQLNRLWK